VGMNGIMESDKPRTYDQHWRNHISAVGKSDWV